MPYKMGATTTNCYSNLSSRQRTIKVILTVSAMRTFVALLATICVLIDARPMDEEMSSKYMDYFQEIEKRSSGAFWIRSGSKNTNCEFKGYAPNGPIQSVKMIVAPKATMASKEGLESVLGNAAGKLGKAAGFAMHALKFSATITKAAPMLGPALGVLSVALGMVKSKPSAQDILNQVNTAIGELTAEVNKKLDQMEGYVDSKVAKAERELISAEYASSYRLWAQCVELATEEDGTRCQRDSIRLLVAKRPKFTPESGSLTSNVISFEKVRKLEAYMLAFRDYANLVVMQLSPLLEYYCVARKTAPNSAHYCDLYSNKMISEATFFITYANQAIAAIKKGHWGTRKMGNCPNTQTCKHSEIWEGWGLFKAHTANTVTCECEIESSNTKKYCSVSAVVRTDGKTNLKGYGLYKYNIPSNQYNKAGEQFDKRWLAQYSHAYQTKNFQIMEKYWRQEVLEFVPEWEKAVVIAKEMKQKNPKQDQVPVFDEFSPQFQSRLDAAGHRFVDVELIEAGFEDVVME